ncbi:uncharacterized protein LOC117822969 [Notolabrus celidotus]|uniref:uncharacterized protein LOC117822969 n=1 Tax=Notolabrus celidotus TaxID=1203425 RepID=UPI0014900A5F|nr:uncharacterized protein LOC117822969 [Notolabrus celidotus]
MHIPLLIFLSAVVLRCASAGGSYCAKTARARAAALGLDYPGTHGAPDFSGPPHNEMHPLTIAQSYLNNVGEMAETDPNMASYGQNQPGFRPLDERMRTQSQPRRFEPTFLPSHGIYNPEYTPNQGLSFPRGRSVINHHSDFERVKHVAPRAPGRPDLVQLNPHSHNKPPTFVQNEHDLVVDESVPNRRGVSLSGPPLLQSRGRATNQRGYGLRRGAPMLGSAGFANKEHGREMSSQGPVGRKLKRKRFPGRLSQPLNRRIKQRGKQLLRG